MKVEVSDELQNYLILYNCENEPKARAPLSLISASSYTVKIFD